MTNNNEYKIVFTEEFTKNSLIIDNKFNMKWFKTNYKDKEIFIDFNFLNLDQKLFGNNKKETKRIQKNNYTVILRAYKILKKIIEHITREELNFNNTFFIKGKNKRNNNDKMIEFLLNIKSSSKISNRLDKRIEFACDYLDMELSLNNICDFQNGKCLKYRKNLGSKCSCCKKDCKYGLPCKIKNLTCKIFMCDVVTNLGYCFYPEYIAILRQGTSFIDRKILRSTFFIPLKKVVNIIWWSRALTILFSLFIIIILAINLF